MPVNVVHSKGDEKKWDEAKHAVGAGKGARSKWAEVMSVYEKMKGTKKSLADRIQHGLIMQYPMHMTKWVHDAKWHREHVPLETVRGRRRPGGRDYAKVGRIEESLKAGRSMDPIVVVKNSRGEHVIADGYHRYLAARHLGHPAIPAYVAEGLPDDGPWVRKMHERTANKSFHLHGKNLDIYDFLGVLAAHGMHVKRSQQHPALWLVKVGPAIVKLEYHDDGHTEVRGDDPNAIEAIVGMMQDVLGTEVHTEWEALVGAHMRQAQEAAEASRRASHHKQVERLSRPVAASHHGFWLPKTGAGE